MNFYVLRTLLVHQQGVHKLLLHEISSVYTS